MDTCLEDTEHIECPRCGTVRTLELESGLNNNFYSISCSNCHIIEVLTKAEGDKLLGKLMRTD